MISLIVVDYDTIEKTYKYIEHFVQKQIEDISYHYIIIDNAKKVNKKQKSRFSGIEKAHSPFTKIRKYGIIKERENIKSEQRSAFPISSFVNFLSIIAMISVPPELARSLKIIALPTAIKAIL